MGRYIEGPARARYRLQPLYRLAREVGPYGGFIAGGCIKDYMRGKEPKDVDVFFPDEAKRAAVVAKLCKQEDKIYENENAEAYSALGFPCIEFVKSIFGTPSQVLDVFDFTVSQFALMADGDVHLMVAYSPKFFEDMALNRLAIGEREGRLHNPLGTLNRAFRYAGYGFEVPVETRITIAEQVLALDRGTDVGGRMHGYKEKDADSAAKPPEDKYDEDIPF